MDFAFLGHDVAEVNTNTFRRGRRRTCAFVSTAVFDALRTLGPSDILLICASINERRLTATQPSPMTEKEVFMKVDGGCHCGRIRYEAEVDPAKVVICHCTDCQTLSGSAFRTVVPAIDGTFRLLSGMPKVYTKIGENGNRPEQAFCPNCGAPIYSAPAAGEGTKVFALRVGTIHQRDQLIPSDQYWFRSSQAWLQHLPTIGKREKQPDFDAKGRF